MKKKYKDQVNKITDKLTNVCVELSKGLIDVSLDGTLETDFDFIEKDKKLYYKIEYTLPVMNLK